MLHAVGENRRDVQWDDARGTSVRMDNNAPGFEDADFVAFEQNGRIPRILLDRSQLFGA